MACKKSKGTSLVLKNHRRYYYTKVARTDGYVSRKQRRALFAARVNSDK